MKINSNLPKKKKISQDEEDKSKLKYLNRSKPIGKKSTKKKFKNELEEEVYNCVTENIEVVLSQVNFDSCGGVEVNTKNFRKPFVKFALETIAEESLEDLEELNELERNSIEVEEKTVSIENIEEDTSDEDFISPFTEEELNSLMPFVFENKTSLGAACAEFIEVSDIKPLENPPLSCNFIEEFEIQPMIIPQPVHRELQSCPIAATGREKENFLCLVNKPIFPVFEKESNVELESKPSSTNISITGINSELSVQSVTHAPSMKLADYIALKRSLSAHDDLNKNEVQTSNLQTDVRSTFRSICHLICRFLESPHLIYIVVFIGSTYITLNCVFHDSFHGADLVWNVLPSPFSSAAF